MRDKEVQVSVCMITYNHEKYIREAIDGVLMQQTNFKVELVIGEDCSKDHTAAIIQEYETKYPERLKVRYNRPNLGMMSNYFQTLADCSGKYIAFCEGDDCWTDPRKLQKQYDFMEQHPHHSAVAHPVKYLYGDEATEADNEEAIPKDICLKDVLNGGGGLIATNSLFIRKIHTHDFPAWVKESPVGDMPLCILLAHYGLIGVIPEYMAGYRVMADGSWSAAMHQSREMRRAHYYTITKMWKAANKWTNYEHNWIIRRVLVHKALMFTLSEIKARLLRK